MSWYEGDVDLQRANWLTGDNLWPSRTPSFTHLISQKFSTNYLLFDFVHSQLATTNQSWKVHPTQTQSLGQTKAFQKHPTFFWFRHCKTAGRVIKQFSGIHNWPGVGLTYRASLLGTGGLLIPKMESVIRWGGGRVSRCLFLLGRKSC